MVDGTDVEQLRRRRSDVVHSLPSQDEWALRRRMHGYTASDADRVAYNELCRIDQQLEDDR